MTFESLNQQVHNNKGKDGWPADLTFKATEGDNVVEVTVGDARSAKDGFWKRIDPWGLAFFHKAKDLTKKPLRLTFLLRSPETPQAKCQYEALKRRVSYLADANNLQIALLNGDYEDRLYTNNQLTIRPDTEIVHDDINVRGDDDTPGRLEKDFQAYLFGKGLYDSSDPDTPRTNERLALFGKDFVRIGKINSGANRKGFNVLREFPTGVFREDVKEDNRLLPTEFVDLVTINRKGQLAVIEIKFDDANLEVISQVLNYALFFHSYQSKLTELLDRKLGWGKARRNFVTYLVSNTFHNKFKSVWPYYSHPCPKPLLTIRQVIMGHMPDIELSEAA